MLAFFNAKTDQAIDDNAIVGCDSLKILIKLGKIKRRCGLLQGITCPPFVAVAKIGNQTDCRRVANVKACPASDTKRTIWRKLVIPLDDGIASCD